MKSHHPLLLFNRARRIASGIGILVSLVSDACGADVNYWTKATSGYWEEPQWSLGVLPNSTQSVAIVNPGWKAVAISPSTPVNFPASLTVNDLTVGCSGAGWNTLLLNFFGTAVPLRVLNGMSILGGGTVMNLSSGLLVENGSLSISGSLNQDGGYTRVGNGSLDISGLLVQNGGEVCVENGPLDIHGAYAQNGGYVRVENGSLNISGSLGQNGGDVQATNVMTYVDGDGAYNLTNGTFQGGTVQLGADSHGSFHQYGGEAGMNSLTVGGITIGFGSGIYNLHGGYLAVRDTLRVGGYYSSGEFFQFGGTNAACLLKVSPFWSGPAIYHLNGGSLNTDFSWISGTDFVSTTFEQNGGRHIVANTLTLYGSQSHGGNGHQTKYSLKDGTLSARFIKLDGGGGYSVFAQTNGTTSVSDTLFLNWGQSMYIGNVFLHGGTLACANVLSQAAGDNILQTGGDFIVTSLFSFGGHTSYGYPESPTFQFNGGTLTASNIDLSAEWVIGSSAQTGRVTNSGYFKLSGTLQISNATELLGRFILASNATINLAGSNGLLSFADSRAENWNEACLLIVFNWNGLPGGGGTEQLKFGTNQFGLTAAQLGKIRFGAGYPLQLTGASILHTGEVVPAETNPPSILFARQESNLVLSWPSGWVLQSATNVAGFYTDVPNVTSPYTNDMTASARRFFRLRRF